MGLSGESEVKLAGKKNIYFFEESTKLFWLNLKMGSETGRILSFFCYFLNSGSILILDKSIPDLKASGLENLKLAWFLTSSGILKTGNLI